MEVHPMERFALLIKTFQALLDKARQDTAMDEGCMSIRAAMDAHTDIRLEMVRTLRRRNSLTPRCAYFFFHA